MVKRKKHIVKSGIRYHYLKDNHSLNDLSNGFILFTYHNSQDRANTLQNINIETSDTNYNKLSALLNKSSKFVALSSETTFNNFKIFCNEKSSLFITQSEVIEKKKINIINENNKKNENNGLINSSLMKCKYENIKLKDTIRNMRIRKREEIDTIIKSKNEIKKDIQNKNRIIICLFHSSIGLFDF